MPPSRPTRPARHPARTAARPRTRAPDRRARTRPEVYRPAIERALIALAAGHGRATAPIEAALARIHVEPAPPAGADADTSREARLRAALVQARRDRDDLAAALALPPRPAATVRCPPGAWPFLAAALAETRGALVGDREVPAGYWLDYLIAGGHRDVALRGRDKLDYPDRAHPAFDRGTVLGARDADIFGLLARDDDSAQVFAVDPTFRILGDDVIDFVERAVADAIASLTTCR